MGLAPIWRFGLALIVVGVVMHFVPKAAPWIGLVLVLGAILAAERATPGQSFLRDVTATFIDPAVRVAGG